MRTGIFGVIAVALPSLLGAGCALAPGRSVSATGLDPAARDPAALQPPPLEPMTIGAAVDLALRNYPSVRGAQERERAAEAGVGLAKTAYLPRVDLLWQELQATHNNIAGTLFPQAVIPTISQGPLSSTTSWTSRWGSAGGVLLSWEPVDFGLREAATELARTGVKQANADAQATRLDVASVAADAFLAVVATEQTLRAAEANVERWQVITTAVRTLVRQQLRPGADQSRAEAELAAASNGLIQAQQVLQTSRITLAEALGVAEPVANLDASVLLASPWQNNDTADDFAANPLLLRQGAAVEVAQQRTRVLDRTYAPRLQFEAALSGRGSGFGPTGQALSADKGLYPDRGNWAAGLSLSFPVMDYFSIDARRQAEAANARAEQARFDQVLRTLRAQGARARSVIDAARRLAENTPIQLAAARESHVQTKARYESGLGTLTEVAEAQQLLVRAEIDDALARVDIWRALLAATKVQGDLQPFLDVATGRPLTEGK